VPPDAGKIGEEVAGKRGKQVFCPVFVRQFQFGRGCVSSRRSVSR
jgi:hypothetical protein